MEFSQVLKARRMVRTFKTRPVEAEKLWRIIQDGHRAPSAGHLEPQEFVVVRDRSVKLRLARAALDQMFIADAPVVIVVCSDPRRNMWRYGGRGRSFYSVIDGAFASMLILLSSVDEGLGACFVGAFRDDEVSKVLNLPSEVKPIGIIPIGYPGEGPERLARRPLQEKVHFDRWGRREATIDEVRGALSHAEEVTV